MIPVAKIGKWVVIVLSIASLTNSQPAEFTPSIDPEHFEPTKDPCYDFSGKPQRCVPDFINAAFNRYVHVTNTCGERQPIEYCAQSKVIGNMRKTCEFCDARLSYMAHPATFLTDFNSPENETWWQSETMNENIQYPQSVNLTLKLGKSYDVTYVRLKFVSPRPESFAIFKKTHPDDEWIPWQYYSASCRSTYKLAEKSPILPNQEDVAQCTREYSDISPLTGGNIAFSTLEGRPSAHNFEENDQLQEFVTASEIMVVFNRMNTFGDELFQDTRVLKSYYYAVSDFAVGARCKCNGHASECVRSTGAGQENLVCSCQHFTAGADCNECAPFYNDRKWKPATSNEANECVACDCNNLSNRCYYDEVLYEKTGRGGHCIDCAGNTKGAHCEECALDHWRRPGEHFCVACKCHQLGSTSTQCNADGLCTCKPGVGGAACDRCLPGFFDFGPNGCRDCGCDVSGSANNTPTCQSFTGDCACKGNVEGKQCSKCKPGYFNLSPDNEFGCTPCFCYGHSSICSSTEGFFANNITSSFENDKEKWTATSMKGIGNSTYAEMDKAIAVRNDAHNIPSYFNAPEEYLGDQRASYNQYLTFTLKTQLNYPHPGPKDIVIVGGDGQELSLPITAQKNGMPSQVEQTFRYKIHASTEYQWTPKLNDIDFIAILSNVTAIKIRATYNPMDVGFLSHISMGSVTLSPTQTDIVPAGWVETCSCLEGYVGQFCESCADGYRREKKFGGAFNRCVKCECNTHSDSCDQESHACLCEHNTDGTNCERCARGYYGNALLGKVDDCAKCGCPNDGPCVLHTDGLIICTECETGYSGRKCNECSDGYFGNPAEGIPCQECNCNGNMDANAIGNCDVVSGECKKCEYHTTGFNCEKCQAGFWGEPLADLKGDCQPCQCFSQGTIRPSADYTVLECSQEDGQCECQSHVVGPQCNLCEDGYFNITSGSGCESCDCDPVGSLNVTCDIGTGQCLCKEGVSGRRCDKCDALYFGFSNTGCNACDCNPVGSENLQCDKENGQCLCKDNVESRQCGTCIENRYNLQGGCLACDECYNVIQSRTNEYRDKFALLNTTLHEIIENPVEINDDKFDAKVKEVLALVKKTHDNVMTNLGDDSVIVGQVHTLRDNLKDADEMLKQVDVIVNKVREKSYDGGLLMREWRNTKENALGEMKAAREYLEREGASAWDRAEEAAKKYGDQSETLSKIAQEARELAEKQEEKANQIAQLSDKSKALSQQALTETKDAIYGNEQTSIQINKLQEDLNLARNLVNQTRMLSEDQQKEAGNANRAAAETLNLAMELKIPDLDINNLVKEAKTVLESADQTKEHVKSEVHKNKEDVEEIERLRNEVQAELDEAKQHQKQNDQLLSEINGSKERALKAVESTDNVFEEAAKTLQLLKDFQSNVDENKGDALDSLGKIDKIKERLVEVEGKADATQVNIGGALFDAETAQKISEAAEVEVKEILEKARKIREETEATKVKSAAVLEETKRIEKAIEKSKLDLEEFKNGAKSNGAKGEEAVTVASNADNLANNVNKTLVDATERIQHVLNSLQSLDNVNNEELDVLETKLKEAESVFNDNKLDSKLQGLRNLKKEQDKTIGLLKTELDSLKADAENLEQIQQSLPKKCFNVVSLEQEGQ